MGGRGHGEPSPLLSEMLCRNLEFCYKIFHMFCFLRHSNVLILFLVSRKENRWFSFFVIGISFNGCSQPNYPEAWLTQDDNTTRVLSMRSCVSYAKVLFSFPHSPWAPF